MKNYTNVNVKYDELNHILTVYNSKTREPLLGVYTEDRRIHE